MLVRSHLLTDTTDCLTPFWVSVSSPILRKVLTNLTQLVSPTAMLLSITPSLTLTLTIVLTLTAERSRVVFYALPKVKDTQRHGSWIVSPSSMPLTPIGAILLPILVGVFLVLPKQPRVCRNSARAIRRILGRSRSLNSIYSYKVLTMLLLETRKTSGMYRSSPTKIQRGHWLSSSALCLHSNPTRSATSSRYSATFSKN